MDPRTCSDLYKTDLVQDAQTKGMRKFVNMLMKEQGGLPANAAADYKKGFKLGFMAQCKQVKKEAKKSKKKKKSKKTKTKRR
jgi:hypothetical protein